MEKFKSLGEYIRAIKDASEGKKKDSRLILKPKNPPQYFTEEELQKILKWSDELLKSERN